MTIRSSRADRHGLTLIELVLVLVILVVLASMVVPRFDFLKNQADHASAAKTAAELTALLQSYRTQNKAYPLFDLLVDTTGTPYAKVYTDGATAPLSAFSVPNSTATNSYYQSIVSGGLLYGWRHAAAATDASDSATSMVNMKAEAAAGTLKLASITGAGTYNGYSIFNTIYPGVAFDSSNQPVPVTLPVTAAPTGVELIAVGIGPRSGMAGYSMTNVPLETDLDDPTQNYCRYIAIFAIYASGKPAQLKMVVDHKFRQIGQRIEQFKQVGEQGN